ncbi:hypothetical protein AJ79_06191 [Helicocarpus griseus UAMH5409]|uniref:FAD-binding PCMH-type domain-containing protein n=1 Tax=Helicocarpus griseus UAMH5409 TaxID=1447875 RepID=A0A2B7X7S5_9EURO|nr:hypothetical protein AJ79_06191 [Helicocarpus griseus UAMH5409]
MAFGDLKSAPGELLSENKAIVDTLAGYGFDVFKHVSLYELIQPKSAQYDSTATACRVLCENYHQQVITKGTPQYTVWRSQFWSQQQSEVKPACVFEPTSSAQVAVVLLLVRMLHCQFSVKSGGHAAFANSSSIPDGVTIDLGQLNTIELSSDRTRVKVGAGNRWVDVYNELAPKGVTAVGGRVADIGVGGLMLGGGISFYSAQYGFACDNVNSFEVVVADGRILHVSPKSHPSLYWALRGGGNNFGIVTEFNLATYPAGDLWAGSRIYDVNESTKEAVLDAVIKFGHESPTDPKAAMICNFVYSEDQFFMAVNLEYTEPVVNPPIFESFRKIPQVADSMDIKTLPEVTLEFRAVNPDGLRESYWTSTVRLDTEMLTFAANSFMAGVEPIKNVPGILPTTSYQILTSDMIEKTSEKNGPNALGLDPREGPLLLVLVSVMWASEADDEAVLEAVAGIINSIRREARSRNMLNDFIYMNYASQFQSVVESYGPANQKRLIEVARRYDPSCVFQTLQPGYFKLTGAPDPNPPISSLSAKL